MQDLWTIVFGTAIGLALGGVLASCYDVIAQQRLTFALPGKASAAGLLLGMLLRVAAGPFLLARNAYDALGETDPNFPVVVAVFALAAMWACFSGLIVIDLLGGFAPAAAALADAGGAATN